MSPLLFAFVWTLTGLIADNVWMRMGSPGKFTGLLDEKPTLARELAHAGFSAVAGPIELLAVLGCVWFARRKVR